MCVPIHQAHHGGGSESILGWQRLKTDLPMRAEEGSAGGAVGPLYLEGEADEVVEAGLDSGEIETFDDPDFSS